MKIHLSTIAADNLQKYENYYLKCRGEISVKGKGIMKTYFLHGKTDGSQSLPSIHENNKSITTSTSADDICGSSPTSELRHISTVSNALESRVGIGHIGDVPDVIHKCKSRPSLASILSCSESKDFNPIRRSSSTETSAIIKSNLQANHVDQGIPVDSASERTTSMESGYFPADSSCSSIERNSPGVQRTYSFDINEEVKTSETASLKTRKQNIFSSPYFPPRLDSSGENGHSVIQRYSLETCIDTGNILSHNPANIYVIDPQLPKSPHSKSPHSKSPHSQTLHYNVDCLKECVQVSNCDVRQSDREHISSKCDVRPPDRETISSKCDLRQSDRERISSSCDVRPPDRETISSNCDVRQSDREHMSSNYDVRQSDREHISSNCDVRESDREHISSKCNFRQSDREHISSNCDMRPPDRETISSKCEVRQSERENIRSKCDLRQPDRETISSNYDIKQTDGIRALVHENACQDRNVNALKPKEIILSHDITNGIDIDMFPLPEQRIRRRSSTTIMTEVTAL
jgi:hypothetical protein